MTSISAKPTGSSNPNAVHRAQAGTGHFMLTLCPLAAPVSIRQPQSPQLKPFTFFMSRARQPDGSERLYLHMGYFETLADAERWVESVRRHYPKAFATIAPAAFLRPANSEAPSLPPAAFQPVVPQSSDPAPVKDESLTDTQVLKILETRRVSAVQDDVDERNCDQIALLRPDDTGTRQALKEAVVQGAPVSFAVQLHWSAQPIDLSRVPSLAIFKALYALRDRKSPQGAFPPFSSTGFLRRSDLCEASRCPGALDLRLRSCGARGRAGGHARTRSRYEHLCNPVSRGATSRSGDRFQRHARFADTIKAIE